MFNGIKRIFRHFVKGEDGAVTVDWVVLTAALVTISLIGVNIIRPGVVQGASNINDAVISSVANF